MQCSRSGRPSRCLQKLLERTPLLVFSKLPERTPLPDVAKFPVRTPLLEFCSVPREDAPPRILQTPRADAPPIPMFTTREQALVPKKGHLGMPLRVGHRHVTGEGRPPREILQKSRRGVRLGSFCKNREGRPLREHSKTRGGASARKGGRGGEREKSRGDSGRGERSGGSQSQTQS